VDRWLAAKAKTLSTRTQPPSVQVWRSVRDGGDTKTKTSRRTLALPRRCVEALQLHRVRQSTDDGLPVSDGLVFVTASGDALDAANVRRALRQVARAAGLDALSWIRRS
jgi:hypothetical protein